MERRLASAAVWTLVEVTAMFIIWLTVIYEVVVMLFLLVHVLLIQIFLWLIILRWLSATIVPSLM